MFRKCMLYYQSNLILYWKHLRDYNFRIRIIMCTNRTHITFALASRHYVVIFMLFMHIGQTYASYTRTHAKLKNDVQHRDARLLNFRWNFVIYTLYTNTDTRSPVEKSHSFTDKFQNSINLNYLACNFLYKTILRRVIFILFFVDFFSRILYE